MNNTSKYLSILFLLIGLFLISCSSELSDFERGKKFMKVGDYENAVKSFELTVWEQPDNPDVRYRFGEALEKAGERRMAYKQFFIAAKIGSKEISNRFTERAWELYEKQESNVDDMAGLAIIAHEKNATAQFLFGQHKVKYENYSGLPFLRDALDWSSDKKIVEPAFKLMREKQILLSHAFTEQITTHKDNFEEFGPVIFTSIKDEIIWSRAQKDDRGRYKTKDIKLYVRTLSDTTANSLVTVGTSISFPSCAKDSTMIYYCDGTNICKFNSKEGTTSKIIAGEYPNISENGENLLFSQNWSIFGSDTSGKTIKKLVSRELNQYNFMPKYIHPKDSIIIFLSYRDYYLSFFQTDTAGTNIKQIAQIGRKYGFEYDRSWLHSYDISPDGKNIVFSRNKQLYIIAIESGKEDTLAVYGAYPSFSQDGKKLIILTRGYGETGEVAIVDLEEVYKAKELFEKDKADRKKLLKLLKKATKEIEKEKFEVD